jgi:hypothetical protein
MAKTAWMRLVQKHIGTLKRQGVRGKDLLGAAIAKAKAEYVPKTLNPLFGKTKRRGFHKRGRGTRRRRH